MPLLEAEVFVKDIFNQILTVKHGDYWVKCYRLLFCRLIIVSACPKIRLGILRGFHKKAILANNYK